MGKLKNDEPSEAVGRQLPALVMAVLLRGVNNLFIIHALLP